jgi:hypothetical protein
MPTTFLKNPVDVTVSSTSVGLQVSGTAAAAGSGAGVKPANTLTVTGTPGQATTGNTGQAASAGADLSITAGIGGAAPAGSANGRGGTVTINPGAPGAGAGTASTYGDVAIATAGGRVGIGTGAPNSTLEIVALGNGRTFTSTQIAAGGVATTFRVRKATTGMTTVANGHKIGDFNFSGFDGTDFVASARMVAVVDGAVTTGNVPMAMAFSTGATTLENEEANALDERMRITSAGNVGINILVPTSKLHVNGGVQVGVPTGGDMGIGTINVAGDIYKDGTPYTNPDYVFEQHFGGSNQAGYGGPVPLAQLEGAIKAHGQLPGIGREPMGVFGRQDMLLEKLEEAYLYIIELTRRVEGLEAKLAPAAGAEKA